MSKSRQWTDEGLGGGTLSSRIVPVRRPGDAQRAALIVDVVDAFARLRGSVVRCCALFADTAPAADGTDAPDAPGAPRFDQLLATLAAGAARTGLRRLKDLQRLVERAAHAETCRDVIFSPAAASPAALREAARALEALDAELIGLCVEHVLETRAGTDPSHTLAPCAATPATPAKPPAPHRAGAHAPHAPRAAPLARSSAAPLAPARARRPATAQAHGELAAADSLP